MKNQIIRSSKVFCLFFIISLVFTSCSSSDDPSDEPASFTGLTATISGEMFTATQSQVFASAGSDFFTLVARLDSGEQLDIALPSNDVGVYTITGDSNSGILSTYSPDGASFNFGLSGTITIIENTVGSGLNSTINGTFEINYSQDGSTITNQATGGVFNISYLAL
ncbi:MAG: DUF6252 family protein [Nonlabens sp.]